MPEKRWSSIGTRSSRPFSVEGKPAPIKGGRVTIGWNRVKKTRAAGGNGCAVAAGQRTGVFLVEPLNIMGCLQRKQGAPQQKIDCCSRTPAVLTGEGTKGQGAAPAQPVFKVGGGM